MIRKKGEYAGGMKICFLVDNFDPHFSSVAKCMYNIAEKMAEDNEVIIITFDGKERTNKFERYGLVSVIRGYNPMTTILNKYSMFAYRIYRNIKIVLNKYSVHSDMIKEYDRVLNLIPDIDLIIPTCTPFESVVSSLKYIEINKSTQIIPVLYDRFTFNESLNRCKVILNFKKKNNLSLEKRMIEKSNVVFSMKQLEYIHKEFFYSYLNKFIYVEHPLIVNLQEQSSPICEKELVNCIYAGALYKNGRNPRYMLETIKRLGFCLELFVSGDCESILNQYKDTFSVNGIVSKDYLNKRYVEANVLISIGNRDSKNVASKIFEYMCLGKTIIHFCSNSEDPIIELIENYPNKLIIYENWDEIDNNVKIIRGFVKNNINTNVPYEEVEKIFYYATPKYIADKILEFYNK